MRSGLALAAWVALAGGRLDAQEYKSPIWGGTGGTSSYNLDCGSSGIMVGISGKAGWWIDQIGIICQTVKADGTLGSNYTRGPVGGQGGTAETSRCPEGTAVASVVVRAHSYVEYLNVTCWPWVPSTRRLGFSGHGTNEDLGTWQSINQQLFKCSPEKVGKAFRGKSGSYIDSLQFVCDDYNK